MTEYGKGTPVKEQSKQKESAPKYMAVRKNENGVLQAAISSTPIRNQAAYLDKAFSADVNSAAFASREHQKAAFMKALVRTDCFHCNDNGFISLEIEVPSGQTYSFSYQCDCQVRKGNEGFGCNSTQNIMTMIQKGFYEHSCQLGGKDGIHVSWI